jgi:hypothetical protein
MWWHHGDPGPCPVDDAPHTTCVSADYRGEGVVVPIEMPDAVWQLLRRQQLSAVAVTPPPPEATVEIINVKTYRGRKKAPR